MWYIANWPNMASCLYTNENVQEFQLWMHLDKHITIADQRTTWKGTDLLDNSYHAHHTKRVLEHCTVNIARWPH
jgi:hypothetical protein